MSTYDHDKVLSHWDNDDVESMYDKHLLNMEINLIRQRISEGSNILDAGCGEGEGTAVYADIPNVTIHAVDFCETRLRKAKERVTKHDNVVFTRVDFLGEYDIGIDYDFVVCQRFLINITDWELQKKVLMDLMRLLKRGGRLIMLEGFVQGVDELNKFRDKMHLPPIPVPWHNQFFDENLLLPFMKQHGFDLVDCDGLGAYFILTRGVRPALENELNWDSDFNSYSATDDVKSLLNLGSKFSRLKLWVFEK